MSLKHGLLGLLNYSDMTGYELGKTFHDSLSFFWQARTSQIYRELNKMESLEWLSSRIEFQTDKPNKRVYSLTDKGKNELKNWLKTNEPPFPTPTRSEFLMRLFFASQRTIDENIELLKKIVIISQIESEQMADINENIEKYSAFAISENDSIYWDMTAEFGRASSKMCLDWAQKCICRLEELKK